jgi:hypothetical protein
MQEDVGNMIRNNSTGKRIISATGSIARPDDRIKTTWQTPENIVPQQVKFRLCKDGPKKCAECRLCAFGRWIIEHGMNSK